MQHFGLNEQMKGHCYEGGIRVPMIVKWPGVIRPGAISDALITGTDHYPTILEMVGLPPRPEQHRDGVSFVLALQGGEFKRPGPIFWHSPKARPKQTGDTTCSVIRDGDYKLFDFYDEDRIELYNLAADPYETTDLSEKEAQRAAALWKQLKAWRREVSAFTK